MVHLIVKYDVQCCLFPFFVAFVFPHFIHFCLSSFISSFFFCFQENENKDGSEDEIGGQD